MRAGTAAVRASGKASGKAPGKASGKASGLPYRQDRQDRQKREKPPALPSLDSRPDSRPDNGAVAGSASSATHLPISTGDLCAPDETKPPHQPVVHQGVIRMDITSSVGSPRKSGDAPNDVPSIDVEHRHLVNLNHEPLSGDEWFEQAYPRLLADPDGPRDITPASHWLRAKMWEALRRGQVVICWAEGTIEIKLRKRGWKRTHPPRKRIMHMKPQMQAQMQARMQGCKLLKIDGAPALAIFELRNGTCWDGIQVTRMGDGVTPMPDGFYVYQLTSDGAIAPSGNGAGDIKGPYASVEEAEREMARIGEELVREGRGPS
jgi:hypothetical protein